MNWLRVHTKQMKEIAKRNLINEEGRIKWNKKKEGVFLFELVANVNSKETVY